MTTRRFLLIYLLMMIVVSLSPIFFPSPKYDTILYMIYATSLIILSFIPSIIGIKIACKYHLFIAWVVIVCYWGFSWLLLWVNPYVFGLIAPATWLWSPFGDIVDMNVEQTVMIGASVHFLVNLLFLLLLFMKEYSKKKNRYIYAGIDG